MVMLVFQGWMKGTKEEKEKNAPNVLALIERFNQVSNWVATTIIFEEDLETRRDVLVYFIHLANKCREIHNFNAMMEGQPEGKKNIQSSFSTLSKNSFLSFVSPSDFRSDLNSNLSSEKDLGHC
jgi:hypothetical protein